MQGMNSVEYEIGFRLEEFFFSVFFFIIHLLRKLNILHLRSYGRWSSLFIDIHESAKVEDKSYFSYFFLSIIDPGGGGLYDFS